MYQIISYNDIAMGALLIEKFIYSNEQNFLNKQTDIRFKKILQN